MEQTDNGCISNADDAGLAKSSAGTIREQCWTDKMRGERRKSGREEGLFGEQQQTGKESFTKDSEAADRCCYRSLSQIYYCLDRMQCQFWDANVCPDEMLELFNGAMKGLYLELQLIASNEAKRG